MQVLEETRPPPPNRPLGLKVLVTAHFIFGLAPLLWLVLINSGLMVTTVGSCEGHRSGACAMATGVILGPIIFNGIVTIPMGFGLWKGSRVARILTIAFGLLWLLIGIWFLSALVLYGDLPLLWSFIAMLMVCYGAGTAYYLTRKHVRSFFVASFSGR